MYAYASMRENKGLRLGQAIVGASTEEDWGCAWPELFYESDSAKAMELFNTIVEAD